MFNLTKYLREDLKRVFDISVAKEIQTLNCLVVSIGSGNQISVSKSKRELDIDKSSIKKYIHNHSLKEVFNLIHHFTLPIVDETGISEQKIDIDFPDHFDMKDEKAVIEVLKRAGFDVKEEVRELDVVVITDK
jgi:predicted transcriptional regulator